ncbi:MAG: acyltransferase [Woeseiaceae bacterium]|nr:acyltransferase [Woeseiaceae bacterium]
MRNLQGIIVFLVLIANTVIWFIPLIFFAIIRGLIPGTYLRQLFTKLSSEMATCWISCNAFIFSKINNTKWDVKGLQQLSKKDWYLLVVNHLSWVDIIVLQTIFNRRIPFLKFFIKRELIWMPFLGLAWWAMDMPFMKRYSKAYLEKYPNKRGQDFLATKKACDKFRDVPTSVINFVEGTRFTKEKQSVSASPYSSLLKPRAGGVALAIDAMGDMFDKILDVTIVYPQGVISFWDLLCGRFSQVGVEVEKRVIEQWMINSDYQNNYNDRQRFHLWLSEIWEQKDKKINMMIDHYKMKRSNNFS